MSSVFERVYEALCRASPSARRFAARAKDRRDAPVGISTSDIRELLFSDEVGSARDAERYRATRWAYHIKTGMSYEEYDEMVDSSFVKLMRAQPPMAASAQEAVAADPQSLPTTKE